MMKFKSSCKMPNRRKINLALLAPAILLALVGSRLAPVQRDSAPDWLRAAAAEKLPDYPKDAVAVMLLDELHTTVKDDGDIENTHRYAYKFLRPEARENTAMPWSCSTIKPKSPSSGPGPSLPNGTQIEMKDKEAIGSRPRGWRLFSDHRAKFIRFPEANVGSVVGFEYAQHQRPFRV